MKLRLFLILTGLWLSPAKGSLLVYESFDYSAGSELAGQGSGFGFAESSTWADTSVSGNRDTITTGGAVYARLQTNGNALRMVSPTDSLSGNVRRQTSLIDGAAGTTTWVSYLFSLENSASPLASGDWAVMSISGVTPPGPTLTAHFGIYDGPGGGKVFGIGWSNVNSLALSNVIFNPGEVYFVVARIDWNAGNAGEGVSLYINPPTGAIEPLITESAAFTTAVNIASGAGTNRILSVGMNAGDTGQEWIFDEIRLGTTFADVAPVPEPAILALCLVGAVGIWLRKRK